jgi:hypothetical protein
MIENTVGLLDVMNFKLEWEFHPNLPAADTELATNTFLPFSFPRALRKSLPHRLQLDPPSHLASGPAPLDGRGVTVGG